MDIHLATITHIFGQNTHENKLLGAEYLSGSLYTRILLKFNANEYRNKGTSDFLTFLLILFVL